MDVACLSPLSAGGPVLGLDGGGAPGPPLLLDALLHVLKLLQLVVGAPPPRPVALVQGHCNHGDHVSQGNPELRTGSSKCSTPPFSNANLAP